MKIKVSRMDSIPCDIYLIRQIISRFTQDQLIEAADDLSAYANDCDFPDWSRSDEVAIWLKGWAGQ